MANRKRNIQMKFYVTEDEKRLIDEKMSQLPTRRYGAYLRKMAIDGYLDDGSGGSPWRYSVTTDQYVNSGDFHSVTEAEATAVMDKYTHETLAFTPFVV